MAFAAAAEARTGAAKGQLAALLETALARALRARHTPASLRCLHAFLDLALPERAERAVREVLVAPAVQAALADAKASAGADGGLPGVLARVERSVEAACGALLREAAAPGSGLGALDLLGGAVLAEVSSSLATALPAAFSPGNPAAFHANFIAASRWLEGLEGAYCADRAGVDALRAGPAHAAFLRRWNLAVYCSLLVQELAGGLEDAARAEGFVPAPASAAAAAAPGSPLLRSAVSALLATSLQRCIDPDVFLPQCADRFFKLAAQLCARYASWVAGVATARRDPAAHAGAWAAGASLELLATIVADAEAAADLVQHGFGPQFGGVLQAAALAPAGPGAPDVVSAARGAFTDAARAIADAARPLLAAIAGELADGCVAVVRQLKGITATYRMTSKGPPVRHSHYVTGVLQPLAAFLEGDAGRGLSRAMQQALLSDVVDATSGRYATLADELVVTVQKTESSLKRLKKGKAGDGEGAPAGGPGGPDAMSDAGKICLQLFLDVREYGRLAARMGAPVAAQPSYQALWRMVAPPEQADSINFE